MHNFYKRVHTLLLAATLAILGFSTTATAQVGVIGDFLSAGRADAATFAGAYLEPMANGVGAGFNSGWNITARSHKKLGFDIHLRSGFAVVPDGSQSFNLDDLNLQNTYVAQGGGTPTGGIVAPTLAGEGDAVPVAAQVTVDGPGGTQITQNINFSLPPGAGLNLMPAPYLQASVGLIKGIELQGRYLPQVAAVNDYGNYNMWGVGAKININDWLPGGNVLPVDLAVQTAFGSTSIGTDLSSPVADPSLDPQSIDISFNNWVLNALVGKKLPFIGFYGGVGVQTSTTDVAINGQYRIDQNLPPIEGFDFTIEGDNTIHGVAGFQLKLAVFSIVAEYTVSNYQVLNVGVGFSLR